MLFCEHWGLNTHLKNDFNLNEIKASSTPSLCCSVWYTHVSHNTGFITVAYSIHRLVLAKHGQTNLLHRSPCVLSLL